MGKSKGIPKRWEEYSSIGSPVPGTRFLPFKVPLKLELCRRLPKDAWFTPEILMDKEPDLKAIIDLTYTNRYYDPKEFIRNGVYYQKIAMQGGQRGSIPPVRKLEEFFKAVDQLSSTLPSDALIGVHCTHGLNRTGYLICKYMVTRMKIDPKEAIKRFEGARNYSMEREYFIEGVLATPVMPPPPPPENW